MAFNNSTVIIIIVIAFAFYLIYSQNSQPKIIQQVPPKQISAFNPNLTTDHQRDHQRDTQRDYSDSRDPRDYRDYRDYRDNRDNKNSRDLRDHLCPKCEQEKCRHRPDSSSESRQPQVTNVMIEQETDPYSDPIKKQDLYSIYDPLTYPQLRLPREVLEKYNEYYDKNGSYPPFNQSTQPLFDNPVLTGFLIKQVDENEPFTDNVPTSIPLFKVKSSKNVNRFFYYTLDQRYSSKLELKIPLDGIKVNNVRYNNAEFYGLPELYDGDLIEHISIYPTNKFVVKLRKFTLFLKGKQNKFTLFLKGKQEVHFFP